MRASTLSTSVARANSQSLYRSVRSLIAAQGDYVLPEKAPAFERRVRTLQDKFEARWFRGAFDPDKTTERTDLEYDICQALDGLIAQVTKEVRRNSNGNWAKVEAQCRSLWRAQERLARQNELRYPRNEQSVIGALWWMSEHGMEEELDLIQEVKKTLNIQTAQALRWLIVAEQKILERVNDPYYVIQHGERAYQEHKQDWEQRYAGLSIAICRGQVIDADHDERALVSRLIRSQLEHGRFRAYVIQVGSPPLHAHGPRVRPRGAMR